MAEHPELLGLATDIVSAHVSNNAIAADLLPGLISAGLQRTGYCRTSFCCKAQGRTSSAGKEVRVGKSCGLSRLRQTFFHAEAASDDRP